MNKEETVMYLTEAGMDNGNNLYVRDMTQADAQFIQMCSDSRYIVCACGDRGQPYVIYSPTPVHRSTDSWWQT